MEIHMYLNKIIKNQILAFVIYLITLFFRFRHQFMFSKEQNTSIILNVAHLTMGSKFESLWF